MLSDTEATAAGADPAAPAYWRLEDDAGPVDPGVRGWEARRRLADGRGGATHLAFGNGAWAVLRVLPAGRPDVRRVAEAALAMPPDPHLVGTRALESGRDGRDVAVLDLVGGGGLADHLCARGQLLPGEAVTAVAPLAGAVAVLHGAGSVHGSIDADHVLLTSEGRPVLTDLPGARARGAAHAHPGPDDDLRALGALLWHLLAGFEPGPAGWRGQAPAALSGPVGDIAQRMLSGNGEAWTAARLRDGLLAAAAPMPLCPGDVDDPAEAATRRIPERFLHGGYRRAAELGTGAGEARAVAPDTTTRRRRTGRGRGRRRAV